MIQIKDLFKIYRYYLYITKFDAGVTTFKSNSKLCLVSTRYNSLLVNDFDYGSIFFRNNICTVMLSNTLKQYKLDLTITDSSDFFNFSVLHDVGELTIHDIPVLKEIREIAIKVLNNETN